MHLLPWQLDHLARQDEVVEDDGTSRIRVPIQLRKRVGLRIKNDWLATREVEGALHTLREDGQLSAGGEDGTGVVDGSARKEVADSVFAAVGSKRNWSMQTRNVVDDGNGSLGIFAISCLDDTRSGCNCRSEESGGDGESELHFVGL